MSYRSNKSHRISIEAWALLLIGMFWGICPVQATADSFSSSFVDLETRSTCQIHLDHKHSDNYIDQEIESFQSLAEEALALRAITIKVGKDLQKKAEADIPLTGEDMDLLSFGLVTHLDLRHDLMAIAEAHECWLLMDDEDLHEAGISKDGHLDGIMVSLAAALVMYDNYMMTATLFEGDPKLRQILNEGDQGYQINKAELLKVSLSYHSSIKRARARRAMKYYEKAIASGKYSYLNPYLATLIDQSPSYDMVREWSPLHVLNSKLGLYSNITADSFTILQKEGVSMFSMLFGNSVGLIETRKGKLYDRKDVYAEMEKTLQSGDILLEKTPFRLTDKLIPGYWGHAAVWIGTEEELKKLGIWEDPIVKQHHEAIKNGNMVVEALRSGVEMNRLNRFLNIDSIGVLRKPGLTDDDRRTIVLQSLRQVGKSYDFNFDVESLEKVYCSKLIYLAYHGIDWSVKESFGRTTFTPDDIASNIFVDDALDLVSFYHDGKKVEKAPVKTLASLMEVASQ